MSLNFPSNPSLYQQSTQNGRTYSWNGYAWDLIGNTPIHAFSHSSTGTDPIAINVSQISDISGTYAQLSGATFSGVVTAPSGNFSSNLQVGSTSLTSNDILNIINSTNLYLWSNFR